MSRRLSNMIIYIILFALTVQLLPQSSFAQELNGSKVIDEESIDREDIANELIKEDQQGTSNEESEKEEKVENNSRITEPKTVSNETDTKALLNGIVIANKAIVYRDTDKTQILSSYTKGQVIKYYNHDNDWFTTTVTINGKTQTGFLSKKDVETAVTQQSEQKGVAIKSPTRVYSTASTDSKVLQSYEYGSILKYKTFTSGWHEATVTINGKAQTGYIEAAEVGDLKTKLKGYALADNTHVYSKNDRKSSKLKSYKKGSILQYRAYDSNWFQIDVIINGKNRTGYIHKKDVTHKPPLLTGYALQNSTYVFGSPSKSGAKFKTYKKGDSIKYRPYNSNWYTITVQVSGKSRIGYIHKNDVTDTPPLLTGYALKGSTYVFGSPSKSGSKLKTYKKGQTIRYRPYNSNWYTATVKVGGKSRKGYIHKNDVGAKPPVFTGFAKNTSTYVYSKPDRKSTKLKTYKKGNQLKYYYHNASWYKATVVVKGKSRTGYINVKDVGKASDISFVNPNRVYSYNNMASDIKTLQKAYPDLIKYKVVGKSEYGRNIYAVSLGKGRPKTFINGSHHAREWLTTNLNMYMIEQYAKAYQKNSKIKGYNVRKILNETTIWFIPMVNPDGVTLQQQGLKAFPKSTHASLIVVNNGSTNFKRWKANGKGVDLNRQYDAGWKTIKGNPGRPSYKNYKGKAPATASEVKAVLKLEAEIRPEIAVAYHSSGKILYWNYKQKGANYKRDHAYAKAIGKMTGYGLVYPGPNPSGGGFTDWFIQKRKRPGFTPEISRYVYETNPPVSEFSRAWKENQAVGLYVARESAKLYKKRKKK